jgi:VIT1/CCC1 family predicted Fe2+/Mn2+ transporter/rubrerythrin
MADPSALSADDRKRIIAAVQDNWRSEIEGARLYRQLANREPDPKRKAILERLAEAEERHAARWGRKLAGLGAPPPVWKNTLGHRFRLWLARLLGTEATLRRQEAQEQRDLARYQAQENAALADDAEARQILAEVQRDERAHAKVISGLVPAIGPQNALDLLLRRERWHSRGGGWIGDAIYGVNDGLGAVFGIISGVAGATLDSPQGSHYVLIAGLAGMMASALSMGSGAYLAVKARRELYEAELQREKREVEEDPEEEKEEMALFYQLQGFTEPESQAMAARLAENPEQLLKSMAQSELGLSEEHFPSPWVSAVSAMLSTALGAFIPIIPFFFMSGVPAVVTAAVISLVAHFAVGAAKTLVTMRSWWASGLEMTVVGVIEALITYALGLLFGASV